MFPTFDAEFKFAKIQNSHFVGGGGGSWNLMLSSNLLKSKIPILWAEGGGVFPAFDDESKFAKTKKKNFFLQKKVFGQKCAWEWFSTLSTKWLAYTKYMRTTNMPFLCAVSSLL